MTSINRKDAYQNQVRLLIRILPIIDTEHCFALKGGTAINLFYRELPRLSVDIDLLYVPMHARNEALTHIRAALSRISDRIRKQLPGAHVQDAHLQSDALRIIVQQQSVRIKIELSPVIRGTVFDEQRKEVHPSVEDQFGYAEVQVASFPDLYAGKLCAALDRQHPRDLYDVKFLLDNEGLTNDLRKTFLVFLISHQRPIAELLAPHRLDIRERYESEFAEMAQVEVPVEELEETRELLISTIYRDLRNEEKEFLLSFKAKSPDWALLGIEDLERIAALPSVKWKMLNLGKMEKIKHRQALKKLEDVLSSF